MKITLNTNLTIAIVSLLIIHRGLYAQPREPRPMPPEDRVEQLCKDLSLSDTQTVKVKAILDEQTTKMEKLYQASENERKVMQEAMMKSKKEADEKIAAVLTSDQKEKFIALQKKYHEIPNRQVRGNRYPQNDRRGMESGDQPPMPPEEFVTELKKELNLTVEQEAKIQKIFDEQNDEMKKTFESVKKEYKVKSDEMDKERTAMREKTEKQRKETAAKISAVLTDEQNRKFEELQKKQPQPKPHMPDHENDRPMHEECPDHQE